MSAPRTPDLDVDLHEREMARAPATYKGAGVNASQNRQEPSMDIQLIELHGEPTVRDVDLGARLGMRRPTNIRRVIEKNRPELEAYGLVHAASAPYESGKGRVETVTEYHLSEEQALCVCQLSRAPRAAEVRRMLIQVFTAYRRGHLVPELTASSVGGIVKGIVHKALAHYLETEIPRLVEARLASDPRVAVVDRRSAKEVLDGLKVPSKGRRGLVGRVSYALRSACLRDGEVALRCARTRTWLYPEPLIQRWLNGGGLASVREWQAQKRGELRLFDFGRS